MTHTISRRNTSATKAYYPMAEKLPQLISAMRTSWIGAVEATILCNENRFTLDTRYLVNHLGLTLYIDKRVGKFGEPRQVHHLPVQDHQVIESAVAKLREVDLVHRVDHELWRLVHDHPFPFGDRVPDKPGYSKAEAEQLGIKKQNRGEDGETLKNEALAWITREWVSNAQWAAKTGSTRLADFVNQLIKDGYAISAEILGDAHGHAIYHYFADADERAAWAADYARRKSDEVTRKNELRIILRNEQRQRKAEEREIIVAERKALKQAQLQRARDAKAAAKLASKAASKSASTGSLSGSKPQYGGWQTSSSTPAAARTGSTQLFRAEAPETAPPPQSALLKLAAMRPPKADGSASGVPADELNRRHPDAASGFVAEVGGARYQRRWRTVGFWPDGRPKWLGYWEPLSGGQRAA